MGSFALYLNEGLIKLPPKLTQSMLDYFVYWYLAYLEGSAEKGTYDDEDLDMVKLSIERLAKKHGVSPPTPGDVQKSIKTKAVFKVFPVEDLPLQYLERVAKVKGQEAMEELKKAHVKFVVSFKEHPKVDMDKDFPQGIFYAEPAEVIISIPNMQIKVPVMIELLSTFNHSEASRQINFTLGIVEHETTHAVQSMVLYLLHPSQYDPETGGKSVRGLHTGQAKKEKYFTSSIEFDPLIKTSIRELKGIFGKQSATTEKDKKDLFTKYTYGDVASKNVSKADNKDFFRSEFFKSLKRSDLDKWKKAVKLLSQEVF
jgi:predicted nucleotidyltransferase